MLTYGTISLHMNQKDTLDYNEIDLPSLALELALYAQDKLKFSGAAVINLVTVIDKEKGEVFIKAGEYTTRFSRPPQPEIRGAGDPGTSYLAIARAKATKRLRLELGIDIVKPAVRKGEVEPRGDSALQLTDAMLLITAFSGAPTEEQDQIVTDWGVKVFQAYSAKQVWEEWTEFEKK